MNELLAALARRAKASPADPVMVSGGVVTTAAGLLEAIDAHGAALAAHGVRRLALIARNSPQWVVADLACQWAGVCEVTLPDYFADDQIRGSVERAGADAVLTDDPMRLGRILDLSPAQPTGADLPGLTLARIVQAPAPRMPAGTDRVTFTSGSTGTPRGVCLSTQQQLNVANALAAVLPVPAPRHLSLLPLSTLLENIGGVYLPLLAGGTVIVPPADDGAVAGGAGLDLPKLLRLIEHYRPTTLILIPQMLTALVAALEDGWKLPGSIRFAAVGGAKVAPDLIVRARSFGLAVFEGYGLSESGSVACLNLPGDDRPGTVGRPLPHVDVQIDAGEVCIRGNTFLGYLDDPDSWNLGVVRTGDLGDFDGDGRLRINGRRKNLLISSFGRNISPEWVESLALAEPELAQCVVFGDARPWCVALLAPADPACPDRLVQRAIDRVNARLPDFARVLGWYRLDQPLSPANGLLTDNGRPCRDRIARRHMQVIDGLYYDPLTGTAS